MLQIAMTGTWELLQYTNVTDAQLVVLHQQWERQEMMEAMEGALLMERASTVSTIAWTRASNDGFRELGMSSSTSWSSSGDLLEDLKEGVRKTKLVGAGYMWRASWSYKDELRMLQESQIVLEALRIIKTNRFFDPVRTNMEQRIGTILGGIAPGKTKDWLGDQLDVDGFRGMFAGNSYSLYVRKTMPTEAARRLSISAIACRRYELKHRRRPAELSALVPEFLSAVTADPVDGKPLRYQLNPDGTFLLYSIGDDGVDDGGDPMPAASASKSFNWQRGRDWVWPQPATPAEVEKYFEDKAARPLE